jgi:hypothetical protein
MSGADVLIPADATMLLADEAQPGVPASAARPPADTDPTTLHLDPEDTLDETPSLFNITRGMAGIGSGFATGSWFNGVQGKRQAITHQPSPCP